ncbi:YdcF family protein [Synechococcus moorigangaii CMS01]|nr:YdcF family protein [Synechococcus moorigangaii CMS01]
MAISPRKVARRRSLRRQKRKFAQRRWLAFGLVAALGAAIAYHQIQVALRQPKAIFVLGGHEEREQFAAQFAQRHPDLKVWVSSGSPPEYARQIFAKYQIGGDRLQLDYQAEDTVTNFTSLVDDLKQEEIDSVYLITSENHMNRAKLVAHIVFGTHDITVKPIPVPSENPPETTMKSIRDGIRSILWVVTGETGREWQPPTETSTQSDPSGNFFGIAPPQENL